MDTCHDPDEDQNLTTAMYDVKSKFTLFVHNCHTQQHYTIKHTSSIIHTHHHYTHIRIKHGAHTSAGTPTHTDPLSMTHTLSYKTTPPATSHTHTQKHAQAWCSFSHTQHIHTSSMKHTPQPPPHPQTNTTPPPTTHTHRHI